MKRTTYSYQWALFNGLGNVAVLELRYCLETYCKPETLVEKVFHITDYYDNKIKIKKADSTGEWKDFEPNMVIDGIIFRSIDKVECEGFENFAFEVDFVLQ